MKKTVTKMNEQDEAHTSRVQLCQDGKYRWIYELNMYKNPSIIFVVFKIFGYIFLIAWAIMIIADLFRGEGWDMFWDNTKMMLIFCAVFSVLTILAYLLVAASYGGKYIVLFEMDEKGVLHRQIKSQVKKAQVMGWLTVLAGVRAGNLTTVGVGLNSATKTSSYSSFDHVRNVKAYRNRNLIKVNELLEKNQVYATDEDFDFVYDYIRSHCPNVK
jgi:hypothetical protein